MYVLEIKLNILMTLINDSCYIVLSLGVIYQNKFING